MAIQVFHLNISLHIKTYTHRLKIFSWVTTTEEKKKPNKNLLRLALSAEKKNQLNH